MKNKALGAVSLYGFLKAEILKRPQFICALKSTDLRPRKYRILLFIIIFIFLPLVYIYADTSIKAQVDKVNLTTDDGLVYKITISSDQKRLPVPEFPKFEGFKVISKGQSSNISFSQGVIKTGLSYEFILMPLKTGKLNIPAAKIKIGSEIYSSQAFELNVTKGKIQLKPNLKEIPDQPDKSIPESLSPKVTL